MKKTLLLVALLTLSPACDGSGQSPADVSLDAHATDAASGTDVSPSDTAGDGDTGTPSTPDLLPNPPGELGQPERPATYFVPKAYDATAPYPLVILLHGYSASGWLQDGYFGTSSYVDEKNFFLITPDGTKSSVGTSFWNGTPSCCDFENSGVDDVGYIVSLIDELSLYYHIDPARVYLIGHSNGGFMSYRLACDAGDRITALVSLAGGTYSDHAKCQGTTPVSVLQVHGDADDVVPYGGGNGAPGAVGAVERWSTHNGCDYDALPGEEMDLDAGLPGADTQVLRWGGCDQGTGVELWTIVGGAHVPDLRPEFTEKALDFLLSKSR